MDVGALLRLARERAVVSQTKLAREAGTSQAALSAYESGKVSPSVRTLDRLLAACGLQARVTLEPLMADLDLRVDAMLQGTVVLDAAKLAELAASLDDAPGARKLGLGSAPQRRGPVTWAFDGGTALGLHGLAVDAFGVGLVLAADEAARFWLRAAQVQGRTPRGDVFMTWLDADLDTMNAALADWAYCVLGPVSIRLVEQLPPTVRVVPSGCERPLPVVTVDEVEQTHAVHAEVLARMRQRRSLGQ